MSKTSSYKHKVIPEIEITAHYLQRNVQSHQRLLDIYDGKIAYTADDYPVLINCMERMYKEFYQELREEYPEQLTLKDSDLKAGHHFKAIASKINKIIPLSDSYEGYMIVLEGLHEIENRYNGSRFDDDYTLEDFRSTFRRYETQLRRLALGLEKIQEKSRSEKEDLEIDQW